LLRHQFLGLDASEDPASYFCWPHSNSPVPKGNERVIAALDSLSGRNAEDVVDFSATQYEAHADGALRARVQVGTDVQIVFIWDAEAESDDAAWKYFDADLLPFPAGTYPSLQSALSASGSQPHFKFVLDNSPSFSEARSESPASDDYWGGYDDGK